MGSFSSIIHSLIVKSGDIDPTLLDALTKMAEELDSLGALVYPPPTVLKKVPSKIVGAPDSVISFTYTFTRTNVVLSWTPAGNTFLLYEVRQGSVWSTASRLFVTSAFQAVLDPFLIGTTRLLIKTINNDGTYSANAVALDVIVPPIGNFILNTAVINNFISIDWDEPFTTFNIDYYVITKNSLQIASQIKGTFFSHQEAAAGTFTYGVTAYDIAGNHSTEQTVTATVNGPTDFEVQDSLTSNLSGTITNGKVEPADGRLYVCIDIAKTYEDHFTDNSWASPQEQVDAGYPLWITPAEATATYEETFDFGIIYTNVIVNLSYVFDTIAGTFTFGLLTKVSDDDITYTSGDTHDSFFVTSTRYVKVKFTFTGSDDKALLAFSQFVCTLNVKREVDGAEADVFAADSGGTVISFIKPFKSVESITVTPLNTVEQKAVYDFAGGVNPTQFKVLLFDAGGSRVDGHVSWKARGVI